MVPMLLCSLCRPAVASVAVFLTMTAMLFTFIPEESFDGLFAHHVCVTFSIRSHKRIWLVVTASNDRASRLQYTDSLVNCYASCWSRLFLGEVLGFCCMALSFEPLESKSC